MQRGNTDFLPRGDYLNSLLTKLNANSNLYLITPRGIKLGKYMFGEWNEFCKLRCFLIYEKTSWENASKESFEEILEKRGHCTRDTRRINYAV